MFNKEKKFQSEVTEKINNFIEGDLDCRLNNQSKHENQELADSINFLLEELSKSKKEIEAKEETIKEMNYPALAAEVSGLATAAMEGHFDHRADGTMFSGKYADLISNINLVVDTLVGHIDQIPAPFMIIDNDFNINYMNKAGAAVLGQEPAKLIGEKCYNHFRTSDCQTEKCACARAMKEGSAQVSETDAHPEGKELFIEYEGVPLRDRSGNIIGALETVMDKTEEKKAIRDACIKADYLEKVPTPVMVIDREFNVQFMNRVGAQAVDRTPEACIGQKCFTLFNTGHCNTENCQLTKAMSLDSVCTSDTVARLPSGSLPIRYSGTPLKDENGEIVGALEYVLDISKEMDITNGVRDLVDAAVGGRLDERADASQFEGNYRAIIEGVNSTLDAVICPMNVAAEYIERISRGDIPEKITDEYHGDFNEIKDNINLCIDAVNELVSDAVMLASAGVEGKLDTRADIGKHGGDFRKIVEGVNNCLDAIVTPIEETARVINEYSSGNLGTRVSIETQGDFKVLADTLDKFGRELEAIIQDSNAVLEAIADNDLTRCSEVEGMGEFRTLTDGVEKCRRALNDIVSAVLKDTYILAATAEELSGSSSELTTSANEVTSTVEEIARGAQIQSGKTEEVARAMVDMTMTVQEVATNSQRTAENSIHSNELIQDLGEIAQNLMIKMNAIKSASGESSRHINDLAEKSRKIGEIVNLITSIADQTNLLALNAAIEAARAGEHGRGFAVVADEVRKLAEDSGHAAKQIADLIQIMQEGTNNAVLSMDQATSEVATGAQSLDEAVHSIGEVVQSGTDIVKMVQEIAAAAQEQSASIEEVTSSIEEVSSISQESAASTEEASAAVEQQSASIQELTSSAQQLANVAGELQSIVARFKTDQEENDFSPEYPEEPEHPRKKEKRKTLLL